MSIPAFLLPLAEWLPVLLGFAAKASVILLVGTIASALLWRSSAALRHMVWSATVLSVLALPLLSLLLPSWQLPLLPRVEPATAPYAGASAVPDGGTFPAIPPATHEALVAGAPSLSIESWLPSLAAALALAGIAVGLLWLASGFLGVARLSRRAEIVRDPEWLRTAQDAAELIGLRRPVLLLRSHMAVMPATWGLLWPSVIIPPAADLWLGDRRSAVMAHELAHVKRFDCLTQTCAQVACALLWWHPLIWYAARRLRVERERACDDLVLAAGSRASDYATHLLEIARTHRASRLAAPALLSMAKPSQLESRLLWVLDGARTRTAPSVRATVLTMLAGVSVAAPLSAMQAVQVEPLVQIPRPGPVGETLPRLAAAQSRAPEAIAAPSARAVEPATAQASAPQEPAERLGNQPAEHSFDELLALRRVGVDGNYIRELGAAGYSGLTSRQLAIMKGTGVSASYIEEMNAAGFGRLTPEQLASLSSVGVRAPYVQELERRGLTRLSVRQVARLHAAGVTGDYIDQMRATGLQPLNAETLVDLHAVGITPAVVRDLTGEGFGPLTPAQLMQRRTQPTE
jgi:beta-lactamase regulating signal transducer with metallopeptidase domain